MRAVRQSIGPVLRFAVASAAFAALITIGVEIESLTPSETVSRAW